MQGVILVTWSVGTPRRRDFPCPKVVVYNKPTIVEVGVLFKCLLISHQPRPGGPIVEIWYAWRAFFEENNIFGRREALIQWARLVSNHESERDFPRNLVGLEAWFANSINVLEWGGAFLIVVTQPAVTRQGRGL